MKAIKCELCGSNEFVKEDNYFVCQYCKTKYTTEEAKKLMIEGKVDVSGSSVKIDKTDELKNLYELARRAKDNSNDEDAKKYYDMILIKDATSWEANFYSVYYRAMNCKIGEIQTVADNLSNYEESVLKMIKDNISEPKEQEAAIKEILEKLIIISDMLFKAAKSHYYGIDAIIRKEYAMQYILNSISSIGICSQYADNVISVFGDTYGRDVAVPAWKNCIDLWQKYYQNEKEYEMCKKFLEQYAEKISQYDGSFELEDNKDFQSNIVEEDNSGNNMYATYAIYTLYIIISIIIGIITFIGLM